jgi:hypothetical protein
MVSLARPRRFLRRRMGYGTVGGCLGCLTVIFILAFLFFFIPWLLFHGKL